MFILLEIPLSSKAVVPTFLTPGTSFLEDNPSTDRVGSGPGMTQAHHVHCTVKPLCQGQSALAAVPRTSAPAPAQIIRHQTLTRSAQPNPNPDPSNAQSTLGFFLL